MRISHRLIRQATHKFKLLLVLLSVGCGLCAAQSQETRVATEANLTVHVVDSNGAVLKLARVQLWSEAGKRLETATDAHGEALFASLLPGSYRVRVEMPGFEPQENLAVSVKAGRNRFEAQLDVAKVKEEVDVKQNPQEEATDRHGIAFTTVLTGAQLAQLPDDPEEFNAVLREMAGPGAIIRVNGFGGGKLPPKSQISEVRFRLNPYAAENHLTGFVLVDIYTKPGLDQWHGTLNFGFRDESLNARAAFAPLRGPEQYRRFGLALDGPLWAGHTSLFLSAEGNLSFDAQTIYAALPDGPFNGFITTPARTLNLSARVEHVLTRFHTLRAGYQRNAVLQNNLGVGNFDLPERAYSRNQVEHLLRVSDSGPFGQRVVNEVRFQTRWQSSAMRSASDEPAVLVPNAFNSGGAQINSGRRVRELELADDLDIAFGKHSVRAGALLGGGAYESDELNNATGTFTFASLAAFSAASPTTFTERAGDPLVRFTRYQFGWYVQDDLRVRKNFSLNFGLRQEWQTNVPDSNNFAPRAGFAWSPFKDGKTTLRGGAGIFYDWFDDGVYEQTLRVDGLRQHDLVVISPGFPDPFSAGTQTTLAPSRIQREAQLRLPYVWQGSVGMERQLTKNTLLRTTYVYQRGLHQLRGRNINAPAQLGLARPDPTAGNITQVEAAANSSLHLFNLNLSPNFQKAGGRLFWIVNYTFTKAVSEADSPLLLPADNFNLRAERGPSSGVAPHRFLAIMNLRILRDLRLGTIIRANSGLPYNITTGFDDNGDSVSNDRPQGVKRNSAHGAGQWDVSARLSWSFGFGTPTATSESGGAKVVRTGGDSDTLGALPSRGVNKRWRMQTYIQAFNLFNHLNPGSYSGIETSPFFGRATVALPGRRIETGVQFSF